jgi:hypothetical protein
MSRPCKRISLCGGDDRSFMSHSLPEEKGGLPASFFNALRLANRGGAGDWWFVKDNAGRKRHYRP